MQAMGNRVTLIRPPSDGVIDDRLEAPLGLLYIAAMAREKHPIDIGIVDMSGCEGENERERFLDDLPCSAIFGISCLTPQIRLVKRIVERIRKNNHRSYIVVGGVHPSSAPKETFDNLSVDALVMGEGEDVFSDAMLSCFRGAPRRGILKGAGRADVDSYPVPARDLVDLASYTRRLDGRPVISLISSRGCRNTCMHCASTVMGAGSRGARYRCEDGIISELGDLVRQFPGSHFKFNDDHFTGNPNLKRLLLRIKELGIRFRILARIEDLNAETCRLLYEAGCVHVYVGLESLNPDNLRIIGKGSQIGRESNVSVAKKEGLVVRAAFMVGLPFDNDETIEKCFSAAAKLGIDEFSVNSLMPYPGTRLAYSPERYGYTVIDTDYANYTLRGKGGSAVFPLRHKNFGPDDVRKWLELAEGLLQGGGAIRNVESRIAR